MENDKGTITLIGSGEFGQGMARVYRAILEMAPPDPHAAFIDTPAGFELNSDQIYAKAREYFSRHLDLVLELASYKNSSRASALKVASALEILLRADFILAGPGSPTYVVRNWEGSPVWNTILDRFAQGAHLVFASAAAIAMGAVSLPVYEIYKAGAELYWSEGLDLFRTLDMQLAVIPHWNNSEGAHDTRRCFMGTGRFGDLERMLPQGTTVLGIDEHTACVFDPAAQVCRVMGVGTVTIRCGGQELAYASGQTFPFAALRPVAQLPGHQPELSLPESASQESGETTRYLVELARALDEVNEPDLKRGLIERAHNTMHELSEDWLDESHTAPVSDLAPFVKALIEVRNQLRDAKQYALADDIRKRLAALGIELQDSSTGTVWRRIERVQS